MDFKFEIAKLLADAAGISPEDAVAAVEVPANKAMGDYAFPCFRLAKTFRKAPPLIAQELIAKLEQPAFLSKMEVVGAYVNFFLDKGIYAEQILRRVLSEKENYGKSDIGKGKTIVIDYSSPNIAKPFHVGHLRSTVIGNAIYKIYEELGYHCIGINHLGDWGTQFGKLIVAYKNWGSKEAVERDGIQELMRIYVKFHDEAEHAHRRDGPRGDDSPAACAAGGLVTRQGEHAGADDEGDDRGNETEQPDAVRIRHAVGRLGPIGPGGCRKRQTTSRNRYSKCFRCSYSRKYC